MNKEEIYFAEYKGKTPTIEDFVELETKMYTKEQFKKHIVDLYNQLDKSNNKIEKIKEENKSLKLLLDWMVDCDFGLDNIMNEDDINMTEEEFEKITKNMNYNEMLIYYAKLYLKNQPIIDGSDE